VHIDEFDNLDTEHARSVAAVWAAVPPWVDALVAGRPYGAAGALAARAADLASAWGRAELDAALAHHPRIGAKVSGRGAEADASRREQASMSGADADVAARIAAGNRAYEERFGRVFLVRAAGRTPAEMLAELERRLANDDDSEVFEACDQLAQIALLRLRDTVSDHATTERTAS
jgi:2-oxo-4-hydroxy-4-carboxy-5-ureidoimidazoline decarboxylase